AWAAAAQAAGLSLVKLWSPLFGGVLVAGKGPLQVRLAELPDKETRYDENGPRRGIAVEVDSDFGLYLAPQSSASGSQDLQIGDEAFDRDVWIDREPQVAFAILH